MASDKLLDKYKLYICIQEKERKGEEGNKNIRVSYKNNKFRMSL